MKRITMQKLLPLLVLLSLFFGWQCALSPASNPNSPNVLFIAIDDLRPQLNCYGESYMHTPNLDQLAKEGRLFKKHYVQVPTCGASRYALLLGQYPQYRNHTNNNVIVDNLAEAKTTGQQTLPQIFKNNGYYTACLGKISHTVDGLVYTYDGQGDGHLEMPDSWDTVWGPIGKWGTAWNAFFGYADGSNRNTLKRQVSPTEFVAANDTDLPDGLITEKAITELKQRQHNKQPFFMAVGFFKPHLPFVAPKKYWDLYEGTDLPLSPNPEMPKNTAPMALHKSGEMFNNYKKQPEFGGIGIRLGEDYAQHLRRAYYAAVSYTDAQVGKVLQTLNETGLDKNTIVVVWGDHGWHLGDHTIWGKHTLFDRSLKSAFIVKTPDMKKAGIASDAIVETVDIYPTLLDLCQLAPTNSLSGKSLAPILRDPNATLGKPALGFWRTGYSIRTPNFRLTKYKLGDQVYTELYDHQKDPHEMENVANNANYTITLKELNNQILKKMPNTYWESLK